MRDQDLYWTVGLAAGPGGLIPHRDQYLFQQTGLGMVFRPSKGGPS